MADHKVVAEESPELILKEEKGWDDHAHKKNLKTGVERLDRRSAHPQKNAVKKHGHGGKYTIDGPYTIEDYLDPVPAAADERDPNYIDPTDEEVVKEAGIPVVEVAKVAPTGVAVAQVPT